MVERSLFVVYENLFVFAWSDVPSFVFVILLESAV